MPIHYHTGDLFKLMWETKDPDSLACVPHVCNNKGAWGAGFVLAISKLFPPERGRDKSPEYDYRQWHAYHSEKDKIKKKKMLFELPPFITTTPFKLGEIQCCIPGWEKEMDFGAYDKYFEVVNMIAQDGYGSNSNKRYLNYPALVSCMMKLRKCIVSRRNEDTLPGCEKRTEIHCPKFGCGLAGGNWEFIEELIQDCWLSAGINVHVYDYK